MKKLRNGGDSIMKKLEEVLQDWEAVIGLKSMLSSLRLKRRCSAVASSNLALSPTRIPVPFAWALPGALPVPNKAAIESIVLAGLATNCDIEKHSMFYRKNYMYPDMAKKLPDHAGPRCLLHAWPSGP